MGFEPAQIDSVIKHLPVVQPVITFAALGWRPTKLTLQWHQVDLKGGEVRLDAGATKNPAVMHFPLTAALHST